MKTLWFLSTFVVGRAMIARQPQMLQMSAVETGQMSSVETRQMSQQQSSVLSQQQTSVLSQQKTSVLSQQQTFGPEPAEFWPGTRGILSVKSGVRTPRWSLPNHAQWPG